MGFIKQTCVILVLVGGRLHPYFIRVPSQTDVPKRRCLLPWKEDVRHAYVSCMYMCIYVYMCVSYHRYYQILRPCIVLQASQRTPVGGSHAKALALEYPMDRRQHASDRPPLSDIICATGLRAGRKEETDLQGHYRAGAGGDGARTE